VSSQELRSDSELLAAVAALLDELKFTPDMPREAKWRTTEQLANEMGLFGRDAVDRLDRVLREHERLSLERLTNGLEPDAKLRRAKYPDRTSALPLWGSATHHGQPWVGFQPDRSDPPEDLPATLFVPEGAPRLFLSHARKDSVLALRLAEALARMGIGSWRFETHIELTGDIADCVRGALNETAGFAALLTRHSIASLWVLTELETSLKAGKIVVLIVDADDALLLELLQSVHFPHPDGPYDLSVEYDRELFDRLTRDYGLTGESGTRTARYGDRLRDFLATLPSYLGAVPPGATKRVWRSVLAFPHRPARWSGFITLGHLEELAALVTAANTG
jgi:hypothetical protein